MCAALLLPNCRDAFLRLYKFSSNSRNTCRGKGKTRVSCSKPFGGKLETLFPGPNCSAARYRGAILVPRGAAGRNCRTILVPRGAAGRKITRFLSHAEPRERIVARFLSHAELRKGIVARFLSLPNGGKLETTNNPAPRG